MKRRFFPSAADEAEALDYLDRRVTEQRRRLAMRQFLADLADSIRAHPVRFAALVAVVAFLGWLSGYDVR